MNSKVIFLFVLVATVYADEKVETVPITYIPPAPLFAPAFVPRYIPSYYESILPSYNYYRVANLPADRFPPGVDPEKCPNYPYCGTDAGKLVVPPVAPVVPAPVVAPITPFASPIVVPSATVDTVRILKSDVESDKLEPVSRLVETVDTVAVDTVKSDEKIDEIKTVPLTYYTLPGFASRFYYSHRTY